MKCRGAFVTCAAWCSLTLCAFAPVWPSSDPQQALRLHGEGEKLLDSGQLQQAITVFNRMLESCGAEDFCTGVATFSLARSYLELAQYDKAMALLDKAEQIFVRLAKKNEAAIVVFTEGKVCAARGEYRKALEHFKKAEPVLADANNTRELFAVYNSTAVVNAYICDFDRAQEYLEKAEKLMESRADPKLAGPLNNNRGFVYFRRHDYTQALACYREALKDHERSGNQKGVAITLNNIGQVHEARSEYDEALKDQRAALEIARRIRDPWSESLALNNIGSVELKRGNYDASRKAYEEALKTREELGIKHFAAETLNNIGLVWLAYADYPRAMDCFRTSQETCEAVGVPSGRAWALHNLAFVFKDQGKFKESLACSQEAVAIAREIEDRRLEATALLRLGNLYEYQGWFDKALENYRSAAEIQQEIRDWNFRANTLADIAGILTRQGDAVHAEKDYDEALVLKRRIGASSGELLCGFALFFLEQPRYAPGERGGGNPGTGRDKRLKRALELLDQAEKEVKPEQVKDRMFFTYVKGRYFLETHPKGALESFAELKSKAEAASVRKFAFLGSVGLGLANEQVGNLADAVKAFKEAVDYAEGIRQTLDPYARLTFLEGEEVLGVKHSLPYEGLARVLMRMGEKEESLKWAEYTKARVFAEALSGRRDQTFYNVPAAVFEEDARLSEKLSGLMRGLDTAYEHGAREAIEAFQQEIALVSDARRRHIDLLREKFPLFAATKYPEPVELTHTSLKDGEWVLAYDVTDTGILIYLVQGRKLVRAFFQPVARQEVDRLVRLVREPLEIIPGKDDLIGKLKAFDFASCKRLSDLLLKGILSDLPDGVPVTIIPDGSLGVLPFEMLVLNDAGKIMTDAEIPYVWYAEFFGKRNPVSYYQSITALTLARTLGEQKRPEAGILVMADPVFEQRDARAGPVRETRLAQADANFTVALMSALEQEMGGVTFNRLARTGELAESLFTLFDEKPKVYTGLDASKQRLLRDEASQLNRYGSIVFATHGFFTRECPAIREPILVLSLVPVGTDGFLRMSEIMGLRLNSDLVALTACQSGLGRHISGEGTMGMGRAFQYAGAKAVLMSLWSVNEAASVELVRSFFEHLKAGKTKLDALRLAREEIRHEGFDHPFFWAPFILVGEVD